MSRDIRSPSAGGRAKHYMGSDIKKLTARSPRAKVMQRIVRAYRQKIRRQLQNGQEFAFWHVIGNIEEPFFAKHIEDHFKRGMTWNNYGEWQLVNTKPIKVQTAKDFYRHVHYANYIPKWLQPRTPPILKNGTLARQ